MANELPDFNVDLFTNQNLLTINPVKQFEYLEVIDSPLKLAQRIHNVAKKLICILYKFKRLRDNLGYSYVTLIESHICYEICIWKVFWKS